MEVQTEQEAVCTIALKPKYDLLDPNFEGYKLNLSKIPTHSKQVDPGILQAPEADNSYSYQQVRLHALHNHLWQDPWSVGLNFYFSALGDIHAAALDESPGATSRLRDSTVLHLPAGGSGDGDSPAAHPSLALASDRLALVSDGRGALHVAETGDRSQYRPWQVRFSFSPLPGCGFVLVHAVPDPSGGLHVLTAHVAERDAVPEWRADSPEVTFVTLLTWLTLAPDPERGWRLARLRQAVSSGTVHYASLEPAGSALCVAAERAVCLIRDSDTPTDTHANASGDGRANDANGDARANDANGDARANEANGDARANDAAAAEIQTKEGRPGPLYRWSQTADDVTVELTSPVPRAELRVVLESRQLEVIAGGETLLQGELGAAIRRDDSTWTVDSGRLELTLAKVERGQQWSELLTGDVRGQQVTDPDLPATQPSTDAADTEQETERPGPVVGAEVEDCDDAPEQGTCLCRIDGDTHTVTHEASLSGHQYLMTVRLSASEPPAFCIRHDVDGLLWQPSVRSEGDRYRCEHVGTLQAFGFVQASKQQRKFLACAPDLSYALICETSRHIYIYHQPSPVEGDLRNRRSGLRVKQVSRQQVVSLQDSGPILGVTAAPGAIFVLTDSQLHALVLSRE